MADIKGELPPEIVKTPEETSAIMAEEADRLAEGERVARMSARQAMISVSTPLEAPVVLQTASGVTSVDAGFRLTGGVIECQRRIDTSEGGAIGRAETVGAEDEPEVFAAVKEMMERRKPKL
jgi:hypothetical protein